MTKHKTCDWRAGAALAFGLFLAGTAQAAQDSTTHSIATRVTVSGTQTRRDGDVAGQRLTRT